MASKIPGAKINETVSLPFVGLGTYKVNFDINIFFILFFFQFLFLINLLVGKTRRISKCCKGSNSKRLPSL